MQDGVMCTSCIGLPLIFHICTIGPLTITCALQLPKLEYVFRRAIFGAGMGRDDGHYCDVLSSGVYVFIVEGS